jgi:hypothetical protein
MEKEDEKNKDEKDLVNDSMKRKLDPDIFFSTFIVNLILVITTLLTVLYGHSFTTEYYMITNTLLKFQ